MTHFPPPDTAPRMGRPPLKKDVPTVKTTIRVTREFLDRIEAVAGDGKTAAFIRDAAEAELIRREKGKRA